MSEGTTEYQLKGRTIMYMPKMGQKKMMELNGHAEAVTDAQKAQKAAEIKARNKKLAAEKAKQTRAAKKPGNSK